ncbi:MAG TPA: ATP-binding protein, partial [Burkholderiaceae bacterium]|nr:ATP-binding protein [Burkholderiaceae bacterium]
MKERGTSGPDAGPRLADRLTAARRARFVGRGSEIALFAQALIGRMPPFAVLHVVGPGGIGKTTLLQEYADMAQRAGRPVVRLDARGLAPEPEYVLAALAQAMGAHGAAAGSLAARCPRDAVLLIDTIDGLGALDGWWRDVFLPQLPAHVVVVLAGRHAPPPAWFTDVQWAPLTRMVALRNLPPDESHSYLTLRGVAPHRHAQVLSLTCGHPLALSLLADACAHSDADDDLDLQHAPDMVRTLLHKLLDEVPSVQHRLALDACAIV